MASVYFLIQSKKDNSNIYVNFSPSGKKQFRRKTRETINSNYWNGGIQKKGFPKNIHSGSQELINEIQELKEKLTALQNFIFKEFNNRAHDDITIEWFENVLLKFYNNGKEINDLEFLENFLPHYKQNVLPFRLYRGKRISRRTVQKQSTIIDYLQEFILKENPKMKVNQYGKTMSNKFEQYLRNHLKLSDNTIGKYIKYSKTILKEAKNENIPVHPQLDEIKGFTTETPTVVLKENELKIIQELNVLSKYLQISRDWLIIGCYTGQRASDLFRMNQKMIINIDGNQFLNITQQKTGVTVQIPLHDEVKKILDKRNGSFPPLYSQNIESNKTLFNQALKDICKIANLDRLEEGRVFHKEKNKKGFFVHGTYPLYQIISSHVCRRTFATMYYSKIPNQILMSVTGHQTEREFLKYIGVDNSELSKQMFTYWDILKDKETPKEKTNSDKIA